MPSWASPGAYRPTPKTGPSVRTIPNTEAFQYSFTMAGVTRNSVGAILPLCTVKVFRTADNSVAAQTTSDASGNYLVPASALVLHYVVAYLPGTPDVAGTTVNTLVGA